MTAMTSFRANRPLTEEELRRVAPSVFATEAHESRSDRFAPIATYDVVKEMQRQGFQPYSVQQGKTRVPGKAAYTKHLLRFRADSFIQPKTVGQTNVELVLQNANDGTSAYKLSLGVFRLVCLNGMVVGQSYDSINIRHTGRDVIGDVIEGTYRVLGDAPRVVDQVETWQGVSVNRNEALLLANAAHQLRYPEAHLAQDDEGYHAAPVMAERLLTARRWDDQNRDNLWNVFNVLQENTIRGGLRGLGQRSGRTVRATTRAVQGIDQNTNLNRALWTLAEGFAKLKQAA